MYFWGSLTTLMAQNKILCVTEYYLPGSKAGGPIRTVVNMSDMLADDLDFAIITRDRDLGDRVPFNGIRRDDWQKVGSSLVYYASPSMYGAPAIKKFVENCEVLYLNGFFNFRGSIWPYIRFRKRARILIAPRGEFSKGALAIKRVKKSAFIGLAKALGLYRDVQWHASTAYEAQDIEDVFPFARGRIHLALDPVVLGPSIVSDPFPGRLGEVRIVFISRISPKKNLDGLLAILMGVDCSVTLTVHGPIEDADYWKRCQNEIDKLPPNVRVDFAGALEADEVSAAFARHDLFAFPTHGENFGHVIFEALRVGTPVLLSDQTPWTPDPAGAITTIPLGEPERWRAQIKLAADRTAKEREEVRAATLDYARTYAQNGDTYRDNLRMFTEVAAGAKYNQAGG